jgi:hypothetical protein
MPSLSGPTPINYGFGSLAFTTAVTYQLKPPRRHNIGNVIDINVMVTVIFTAVTTPAYVRIGTPADNLKYAELNMGTAAAASTFNTRDNAVTWFKSDINLSRDGVSYAELRIVAPTGGSPTGTGILNVLVNWW